MVTYWNGGILYPVSWIAPILFLAIFQPLNLNMEFENHPPPPGKSVRNSSKETNVLSMLPVICRCVSRGFPICRYLLSDQGILLSNLGNRTHGFPGSRQEMLVNGWGKSPDPARAPQKWHHLKQNERSDSLSCSTKKHHEWDRIIQCTTLISILIILYPYITV